MMGRTITQRHGRRADGTPTPHRVAPAEMMAVPSQTGVLSLSLQLGRREEEGCTENERSETACIHKAGGREGDAILGCAE